ncbi:MAG: F-box protein [Parachlamydiales bacterium]|nr:F-box protein [Parachlamydiales bacterium]
MTNPISKRQMIAPYFQTDQIERLPNEIILSVLSHLGVKDLCSLSLANKYFNHLTDAKSLWEVIYDKTYLKKCCRDNPKLEFKEEYNFNLKKTFFNNLKTEISINKFAETIHTIVNANSSLIALSVTHNSYSFNLENQKIEPDNSYSWIRNTVADYSIKNNYHVPFVTFNFANNATVFFGYINGNIDFCEIDTCTGLIKRCKHRFNFHPQPVFFIEVLKEKICVIHQDGVIVFFNNNSEKFDIVLNENVTSKFLTATDVFVATTEHQIYQISLENEGIVKAFDCNDNIHAMVIQNQILFATSYNYRKIQVFDWKVGRHLSNLKIFENYSQCFFTSMMWNQSFKELFLSDNQGLITKISFPKNLPEYLQ